MMLFVPITTLLFIVITCLFVGLIIGLALAQPRS